MKGNTYQSVFLESSGAAGLWRVVTRDCPTLHPILSLQQTHALGLRDIKHFGNDYNPNKVGAIKSQAPWGPW